MKSKLLAIAVLIAMTGVASARESWQGTFMVTAVAGAGCAGETAVGDHFLATYLPANVSNNGTNTFMGFVRTRGAWSLRVAGLPTANETYSAMLIDGRAEFGPNGGRVLAFSTIPATVTATTQTIVINTRLSNFHGTTGCTATIQGALVLRRD